MFKPRNILQSLCLLAFISTYYITVSENHNHHHHHHHHQVSVRRAPSSPSTSPPSSSSLSGASQTSTMPSPSTCTSYRFSPTIENREGLLARYHECYLGQIHEEELIEQRQEEITGTGKVQGQHEKVKVEELAEVGEELNVQNEKSKEGDDWKAHPEAAEKQTRTRICKAKVQVDMIGTQEEKRSEESDAKRRWRGACKLALHTNPGALHTTGGAAALHRNLGSASENLLVPQVDTDSGKQELDGRTRRLSKGACNLVMHITDKANGDASELDAFAFDDVSRADTNSSGSRACNFGPHTTPLEHTISDPGKPGSKKTPPQSAEKETPPVRKKSACKLDLHTNSVETKKEDDEEEVSGLHTRPARPAPKIEVEEADDDEPEEEKRGGKTSSGNNEAAKGMCRLTLHCGEDQVTPGALLSISLKKQGQASKSRRLSDSLLHQVLITNLVHHAEEEVQRGIRESFCFPF